MRGGSPWGRCWAYEAPRPICSYIWGATRLRGALAITYHNWIPFNTSIFHVQFTYHQLFHYSSSNWLMANDCPRICWFAGQQSGIWTVDLAPRDQPLTTPGLGDQDFGCPKGPLKCLKIWMTAQDPQKSEKVPPRSPKVTKKSPKTIPWDTKLVKKWKKWNTSKTIVFTLVIAHAASAFWHHFHPWITTTVNLETVSHSGAPNHWKITKRCPKWIPRDSQNDPKIDKNAHLDPQVPVGWPLGSLDHQNGHSGYPKWSLKVTKMTLVCRKSDPFQQSASQQLPVDRGAGGRGEALRSAAPVHDWPTVVHASTSLVTSTFMEAQSVHCNLPASPK